MNDMRALTWALTAILTGGAVGCGSSLVDQTYKAPPLALVAGTVTAEPGVTASANLSLAILWAPRIDAPATAGEATTVPPWPTPGPRDPANPPPPDRTPRTISQVFTLGARWVSQSVTFTPTFPFRFEIPIDTVPPASAQLDLAELGGVGRIATGVLIAYEGRAASGSRAGG